MGDTGAGSYPGTWEESSDPTGVTLCFPDIRKHAAMPPIEAIKTRSTRLSTARPASQPQLPSKKNETLISQAISLGASLSNEAKDGRKESYALSRRYVQCKDHLLNDFQAPLCDRQDARTRRYLKMAIPQQSHGHYRGFRMGGFSCGDSARTYLSGNSLEVMRLS